MTDNEAAEAYNARITRIRKLIRLLGAEANSPWNAHYYEWMECREDGERWEGAERLDEALQLLGEAFGIIGKYPNMTIECALAMAEDLEPAEKALAAI